MEELRRINPAFAARLGSAPKKRSWSAAQSTRIPWLHGKLRTFDSKTEARVAARLLAELPPGATIFCQVSVPLLSIAPREGGTPFYISIDFFVVEANGRFRAIDAKTRRKSREWARGRAAAERWLGCRIEECSE